ncbi:MAG: NAD-dependent epimerase/dehydratase family protein [Ilumatobacteraceae bacterium]|nr:NAD-dependent epimerase/dehydratase family protein [Ilumatobacteraceae bacterium]
MKILVTGAGSLLMGAIASDLVRRGDDVVSLQRHTPTFDGSAHARHVLADIRDDEAVAQAARGCDAIIHGAARVGVLGNWSEFESVNVAGSKNVVDAAKMHNVSRLVYVSTPSVVHSGYSIVGDVARLAVTGRKHSFYAESKAIAERMVLMARNDYLAVVATRPHLVWGPGDKQLVGRVVERASRGRLTIAGTGDALVDSTYIDNAVSAHIGAIDALHVGAACDGQAYVIANGEPRTVNELMRSICGAAGVAFEPRYIALALAVRMGWVIERVWPKVRATEPPITQFVAQQLGTAHWFDPRPAREHLGWGPGVSLDEGFARLAQWYALQ